jgi:PAS domain-containing protein
MTADAAGDRGDLLEYATAVATAEDTDTVFDELVQAAERAFDFTSAVVETEEDGVLSVRSWSGEPPRTAGIGADEGLAGHAYQTGETVHVPDVREDPRVEAAPPGAPISVVSVPVGDAGVFQAGRDEVGGFDDADVAVVEQLAEHARSAVERIRSQQRLEASERRFRSLFEDADHPLVLYRTAGGRPGTVEYANEAAEELFDASEAELSECSLDSLLAADPSELVPEDGSHTVETAISGPTSMRVLDVTVKPMQGAAGVDAYAELRDVTEQAQRERVLTSLHDATRRMFVSEDRSEIASVVVEAAQGLVDLPFVGVFFERDGDLHPAAVSSPVSENGPPVLRAGESIPGRCTSPARRSGSGTSPTTRRYTTRTPSSRRSSCSRWMATASCWSVPTRATASRAKTATSRACWRPTARPPSTGPSASADCATRRPSCGANATGSRRCSRTSRAPRRASSWRTASRC